MSVKFAVGDTIRVVRGHRLGLEGVVTHVAEHSVILALGHVQLLTVDAQANEMDTLWWDNEVELVDPFDQWVAEVRSAAKTR